jgi:signal recognition particle receptor subunit beta
MPVVVKKNRTMSVVLKYAFGALEYFGFLGRKYRLLVIGPESSGKTTLVQTLANRGPLPKTTTLPPTNHPQYQDVTHGGFRCIAADFGAAGSLPRLWPTYFAAADAVLFVVDAADPLVKLQEVAVVLRSVLTHELLRSVPVAVIGNKADLSASLNAHMLADVLGIRNDDQPAGPTSAASSSSSAAVVCPHCKRPSSSAAAASAASVRSRSPERPASTTAVSTASASVNRTDGSAEGSIAMPTATSTSTAEPKPTANQPTSTPPQPQPLANHRLFLCSGAQRIGTRDAFRWLAVQMAAHDAAMTRLQAGLPTPTLPTSLPITTNRIGPTTTPTPPTNEQTAITLTANVTSPPIPSAAGPTILPT